MTTDKVLSLSKQDTNALKGIAVLLLLCHHLFYIKNGLYNDITIGSFDLVNIFGRFCKVCVSIFVFLSGYGLMAGMENKTMPIKWEEWYRHRFIRLFLNYWFIWLMFVPIGIFCYRLTFPAVYGQNWGLKLALDLIGLNDITGTIYSYNPTWWFYSCIIMLYLIFPIIYTHKGNKKFVTWAFLVALLLIVFPKTLPLIQAVRGYIFAFLCGAFLNILKDKQLPPPISLHQMSI